MPSYNYKNNKEASDAINAKSGQDEFSESVSGAWNKVKGLIGGGDKKDEAMGESLSSKLKKYREDNP